MRRGFSYLGGLIIAMALFVVMPGKVSAATYVTGSDVKENAAELQLAEEYYYEFRGKSDHWYKFRTGSKEGVYIISYELGVADILGRSASLVVEDQYGTQMCSKSGTYYSGTGKPGSDYYTEAAAALSNLKNDTYYYIKASATSGSLSKKTDRLFVEFVPYKPAEGFKQGYNKSGDIIFSWNNNQSYNTYSSLSSFDRFRITISRGDKRKIIEVGNGGTKRYKLKKTDSRLTDLGYPTKTVKFKLECVQNYHSHFQGNEGAGSAYATSNKTIASEVLKRNSTYIVSGRKYKVTKVRTDGNGEVQLLGYAPGAAKSTKITVAKTVKIHGFTFKITSIGNKAFNNNKIVREVVIGANVREIGQKAFNGCGKLGTVSIRTTSLKKVGAGAFTGMNPKGVIKVPSSRKTKYQNLLKDKYPASVRIS